MKDIASYQINADPEAVDLLIRVNDDFMFLHTHVSSRSKSAFIAVASHGQDRLFMQWPEDPDTLDTIREHFSSLRRDFAIQPIVNAAITDLLKLAKKKKKKAGI